jgi:hypothetical protein
MDEVRSSEPTGEAASVARRITDSIRSLNISPDNLQGVFRLLAMDESFANDFSAAVDSQDETKVDHLLSRHGFQLNKKEVQLIIKELGGDQLDATILINAMTAIGNERQGLPG